MTKRGNGEGTIRHNPDRGRWEGRVTIGKDATGRTIRKKVTAKTRGEVVKRMRDLSVAADDGIELASSMLTVDRFMHDWLDSTVAGSVSGATEDQYRQITRLYIVPHLGRKQVRTLQPRDVETMLRKMEKGGLSRNTQRLARAVLRRALRTAIKNGAASRNVADLADPPKLNTAEGKALTAEQARRLLDHIQGHRMEAAITVALSLGLRRSELLALDWSDIDLEADRVTLRVRYSVKRLKGRGLVRDMPKTAKSRRTIPVPAEVASSLRRHRTRQLEDRLAAGDLWDELPLGADLVFRTATGEAIDPNNFGREVRAAAKGAGIPGIWSPHSLRHSAATLLLAQGVPLKTISDVLGHSSIKVTGDIYAHLLDEAKVEAADAMSKALWG